MGKTEATRSSDRKRNGGFRGVAWPLLAIIKAQPTLVYQHTGDKGFCFLGEIAIPLC